MSQEYYIGAMHLLHIFIIYNMIACQADNYLNNCLLYLLSKFVVNQWCNDDDAYDSLLKLVAIARPSCLGFFVCPGI